jgi:transposase
MVKFFEDENITDADVRGDTDGECPTVAAYIEKLAADKIIALSLSPPPAGYKQWNTALLRKRAIETGIVSSITAKVVGEIVRKYRAGAEKKIYGIDLTAGEREHLAAIACASPSPTSCFGGYTAKQIFRAKTLLKLGEKAFTGKEIAAQCHCSTSAVYDLHKRYREKGLALTLNPHESPPITAEAEEQIRALYRGKPPEGYKRWNVKLLAKTAAEMKIMENISSFYLGQLLAKGRDALNSGEARMGKADTKHRPLLRNYRLTLQPGERERLEGIVRGEAPCRGCDGKISDRLTGRQQARSRILLMLADGLGATEIVEHIHCDRRQVVHIRRRYAEEGIEGILTKPQRHREIPLQWAAGKDTAEHEAVSEKIIALSRSDPPAGYSSWTVKLLAKEAAKRGIAEYIPRAVIERILASQAKPGPTAVSTKPKMLTRPVELSAAERKRLEAVIGAAAGRYSPQQVLRAAMLLMLAEQGKAERRGKKGLTSREIAKLCHQTYGQGSRSLVIKVHQQWVKEGLEQTLTVKKEKLVIRAAPPRRVELRAEEKATLEAIVSERQYPLNQVVRAAILLLLAEQVETEQAGKKAMTTREIAEICRRTYGSGSATQVSRVHWEYTERGLCAVC